MFRANTPRGWPFRDYSDEREMTPFKGLERLHAMGAGTEIEDDLELDYDHMSVDSVPVNFRDLDPYPRPPSKDGYDGNVQVEEGDDDEIPEWAMPENGTPAEGWNQNLPAFFHTSESEAEEVLDQGYSPEGSTLLNEEYVPVPVDKVTVTSTAYINNPLMSDNLAEFRATKRRRYSAGHQRLMKRVGMTASRTNRKCTGIQVFLLWRCRVTVPTTNRKYFGTPVLLFRGRVLPQLDRNNTSCAIR